MRPLSQVHGRLALPAVAKLRVREIQNLPIPGQPGTVESGPSRSYETNDLLRCPDATGLSLRSLIRPLTSRVTRNG